jgi:hypothetical protein
VVDLASPGLGAQARPAGRGGLAWRLWRQPLAVHLLAYGALLALLLVVGSSTSWSSDDGAYAIQTTTVRETGTWEQPYRYAGIDPDGRHFPLVNSTAAEGRYYPYVKQPGWIAVLVASTRVFGPELGLFLPSALAALGAGATAWRLAGRLHPGASRLAFWIVALGPLLIHGQVLWAHAASAALGGLTALAVVDIQRHGPSRGRGFALGIALAGGALLRSEGLLLAAVVLGVLTVDHWWRPPESRPPAAKATIVLAGGVVGVAVVVEHWWRTSIAPGAASTIGGRRGDLGWWDGRVAGALTDLLQPGDAVTTALLGLVAALLVVAVAWRRPRPATTMAAVGGLAVLALVARSVLAPSGLASGLLVAWPVATLGLVAWRWREASSGERWLAAVTGGFAAAVLLTQYPEGGGLEWGGRFFSPVLVPMAALAAIGWQRTSATWRPDARAGLAVALAMGLLAPAALGVVATERLRHRQEQAIDAAVGAATDVVVSLQPFRPRTAWRTDPGRWLIADQGSVTPLVERLRRAGTTSIAVTGPGAAAVDAPGWRSRVVSPELMVLTA